MTTRLYSISPEDPGYQTTEAVGSATVSKSIEVTVDFTALASAGLSDSQAKLQVVNALQRIGEYITKGNWPPA